MSNQVCDRAKDGVAVKSDLIDRCPFIFGRNEKYLAATTNSSYELDIVYSGSMLESI